MSRITALLKDLPADRQSRTSKRQLLSKEQWDEVLTHWERGVRTEAIWAALSGVIVPFFGNATQLKSAIAAERAARLKAAAKK